jgi:UDP-galactopyranose mutase
LPTGLSAAEIDAHLQRLVDALIAEQFERSYILWYYTPMALRFTRHLKALSIVYDCMDELSHFKCAPPDLCTLEDELFRVADVVFTGGHSLYEYKRNKHNNVHAFPSSVDVAHFRKARAEQDEPHDQARIARPRIGFTGVIDERFDIGLIGGLASRRPDWQLVMIGSTTNCRRTYLAGTSQSFHSHVTKRRASSALPKPPSILLRDGPSSLPQSRTSCAPMEKLAWCTLQMMRKHA